MGAALGRGAHRPTQRGAEASAARAAREAAQIGARRGQRGKHGVPRRELAVARAGRSRRWPPTGQLEASRGSPASQRVRDLRARQTDLGGSASALGRGPSRGGPAPATSQRRPAALERRVPRAGARAASPSATPAAADRCAAVHHRRGRPTARRGGRRASAGGGSAAAISSAWAPWGIGTDRAGAVGPQQDRERPARSRPGRGSPRTRLKRASGPASMRVLRRRAADAQDQRRRLSRGAGGCAAGALPPGPGSHSTSPGRAGEDDSAIVPADAWQAAGRIVRIRLEPERRAAPRRATPTATATVPPATQ